MYWEVGGGPERSEGFPRRYFDKSIVPAIGSKPVGEVATEDVRAIIWCKNNEGFDAAAGVIRGVLKRLLTMVRKSELMLARWEHVDFEKTEWSIPDNKCQVKWLMRMDC